MAKVLEQVYLEKQFQDVLNNPCENYLEYGFWRVAHRVHHAVKIHFHSAIADGIPGLQIIVVFFFLLRRLEKICTYLYHVQVLGMFDTGVKQEKSGILQISGG